MGRININSMPSLMSVNKWMGGYMKTAIIITDRIRKKRIQFGMDRIQRELQDAGYTIERVELPERLEDYRQYSGDKIYIGERGTDPFLSWLEQKELLLYHGPEPKKEGF
jgi:hypothetical protein